MCFNKSWIITKCRWVILQDKNIYSFLLMITSEARGLFCSVREDSDTFPNPLKHHATPDPTGILKMVLSNDCFYPSLYKEWFLNQHFSWWNLMHQGCLSLAKLAVAFTQPWCRSRLDQDQTLLLLVIFLLPNLHARFANRSKVCSKEKNKPKIVFLLENILTGLWWKLLEFYYA